MKSMYPFFLLFGLCLATAPAACNTAEEDDSADLDSLSPDEEDLSDDLLTRACDALDIFQTNPWIPAQHSTNLKLIIARLKNNPSTHLLGSVQQVLRCYEALSTLCSSKTPAADYAPSYKQQLLVYLLEEREELTRRIARVAYPSVIAALIIQNLETYLKREPTPEERASLEGQQKEFMMKRDVALKELHKKLYEVEKEILRDHQSMLKRYGPTIALVAGGILTAVAIGQTLNALHTRREEARKKELKT